MSKSIQTASTIADMTYEQKIEYFLFDDGSVSGLRYKERSKFWRSMGLWEGGYFPELHQVALKLMMYKGNKDNLDQTINSISDILPFLKEYQGIKQLGVFEHTLSENGRFIVEISASSYELVLYRYHRRSVIKAFDDLRSLVEYVQEYHYYENSMIAE